MPETPRIPLVFVLNRCYSSCTWTCGASDAELRIRCTSLLFFLYQTCVELQTTYSAVAENNTLPLSWDENVVTFPLLCWIPKTTKCEVADQVHIRVHDPCGPVRRGYNHGRNVACQSKRSEWLGVRCRRISEVGKSWNRLGTRQMEETPSNERKGKCFWGCELRIWIGKRSVWQYAITI